VSFLAYVYRGIRSSSIHSFLSVLAIACAIASLVCVQLLSSSLDASVRSGVLDMANGDVVANWTLSGVDQAQLVHALSEAQAHGIAGQYSLAWVTRGYVQKVGGTSSPVFVRAVNEHYPLVPSAIIPSVGGASLRGALDGGGVVVSRALASRIGLEPGQTAVIRLQGAGLEATRKVVGATATVVQDVSGDEAIFGTVIVARSAIPGLSGEVNEVRIESARPERLASFLGERFSGAQISTAKSVLNSHLRSIDQVMKFMILLSAFTILLAGICISSTAELEVVRRSREMGILRAVGLELRQVSLLLGAHVLVLGIVGGLLGAILGALLARFSMSAVLAMMQLPTGHFVLGARPLWAGVAVSAFASLLFSLDAIRSLRRAAPARAIRGLGLAKPSWVDRCVRVGLLATAIAVVGYAVTGSLSLLRFPLAMLLLLFVLELVVAVLLRLARILPARSARARLVLTNLTNPSTKPQRAIALASVCVLLITVTVLLDTSVKAGLAKSAGASLGWDVLVTAPQQQDDSVVRALDSAGSQVTSVRKVFLAKAELSLVNGSSGRQIVDATLQRSSDARNLFGDGWFSVQGYQPSRDAPITTYSGRGLLTNDVDDVVVAQPVSEALGLHLGDRLTLAFQGAGQRTVRLVGTEKRAIFNFHSMLVPASALGGIASSGPSTFFIRTHNADVTASLVRRRVPSSIVYSAPELLSSTDRFLGGLGRFLSLATFVCCLGAALVMASTVAAGALARRSQVGLVKAIGATNSGVVTLILSEQLTASLTGSCIGLALGVLGYLFFASLAALTPVLSACSLLAILAGSVVVFVAAGMLSGMSVAAVPPVRALRYE